MKCCKSELPPSPSPFPFHTVVVTSPDSESATAASDGPLHPSSFPPPPPPTTTTETTKPSSLSSSSPLLSSLKNVKIYSTSDPFDTRVGSGGGTLAALDYADSCNAQNRNQQNSSNNNSNDDNGGMNINNGSVLIIHAGGQSSRCPTQITLGKAWTSLPTRKTFKNHNKNDVSDHHDDDSNDDIITNPTYILIESLSKVLTNLPNGSVVVAASDVLLSLPMSKPIDFDTLLIHEDGNGNGDDNRVLGLAVPAPLETAKNHGVFVLGRRGGDDHDDDNDECIKPIDAFLQKPSMEQMKNHASQNCVFLNNNKDDNDGNDKEEMAWIDTGVIIFLPKAAQTLRTMMNDQLGVCTQSGIEKLYDLKNTNEKEGRTLLDQSIQEFAKETSVKVELYSHLLLAIPTQGSKATTQSHEERLSSYLSDSMNKDLHSNLLEYIFNSFVNYELQVCVIPNGGFIHLGTTNELRHFLIHGAIGDEQQTLQSPVSGEESEEKKNEQDEDCCSSVGDDDQDIRRCRDFGKRIGIVHKSKTIVNDATIDPSCVMLNSFFLESRKIQSRKNIVGSGTVIEHSIFNCNNIKIGSNCLVSGFRGIWNGFVNIPDNSVFQLIKVKPNWRYLLGFKNNEENSNGEESFVCIYHDINDSIKAQTTCFGVQFDEMFQLTGLEYDDLWEKDEKKRLLWNAKINPIITKTKNGQFNWTTFSWIEHLTYSNKNDDFPLSVNKWKAHTRISLSQLRTVADASFEFSFRKNLESTITNVSRLQVSLLERRNDEIHLEPAMLDDENFLIHFCVLENIVACSVVNGKNDVCSRALLLMCALLRDFATCHGHERNPSIGDDLGIDNEAWMSRSNADFDEITCVLRTIDNYREELMNMKKSRYKMTRIADALEELGYFFTKSCVASGVTVYRRESECPPGSWVVSEAPARIDIFGGWSDTPPISYEHGGSVACLAVLVNKKKPLSARCRLTPNKCGVTLRSESRDIDSNELLWYEEVHVEKVQDLSDFNNPTTRCALLKCALLVYEIVPLAIVNDGSKQEEPIQPFLDKVLNGHGFGLELISLSLLPKGSGMGSSSILAGCILTSIGECTGICFDDDHKEKKGLTKGILLLEQLLTTGGGWQDQVGGLYGGLKLGMTEKHELPMEVKVQQHHLPLETIKELNQRMILLFMGQPRLAKNILRNVLKLWSTRQNLILNTVKDLVEGSYESVEALRNNDICRLGRLLSIYWTKKMTMAGMDSGVEPPLVRDVLQLLKKDKVIVGGTLCGAGGGGFLVAIAEKGKSQNDAKLCIETHASSFPTMSVNSFSWYDCEVSCDGLTSYVEE